MSSLLACLVAVLAAECLFRLPLTRTLSRLSLITHKTLRVIRSPHISDHWKERVLLRYSSTMLGRSLLLALLLAVVAVPVAAVVGVARLFEIELLTYLLAPDGIVLVIAVSCLYIWVRNHFGQRRI